MKKSSYPEITEIYKQVFGITMQKGQGPYKGQNFIHNFKNHQAQMIGLGAGTIVILPSQKAFRLTRRAVLIDGGKKNLWGLRKA